MKRFITSACAALLSGLILICSAQAHDGTVYVSGKINETTCAVSPDSKNFTVDLGSVASKQFNNVGDGSDYRPFVIKLENCAAAAQTVSVHFDGTPDSKNADLLAITSDTASAAGVGIAIYNQDKSIIPLGDESVKFPLTPDQASATLNFYARYIANGDAIVAGTANASATFILTYA
ncbi:MAG TPA: fimbrial protein [Franconibacter helveticus]|uniref:fimbrial protein n=1 Tax=Franconibacter helveticus TaxID=357240 RepID=UPI0003FA21D7|nr:fimbrial protein [Franconibacter helveticus]HAZ55359.1 fimbrial protein [Franconibacter helveticus]